MNTSTKHTILALAVTAFLGSCSRPVAYFQPSKAERFYSAQTSVTPVAAQETVISEPVVTESATAEPVAEAAPVLAKTNPSIEQALTKVEAYASTKARPADARKLERRITKIREVLVATPQRAVVSSEKAQKTTMVQRIMQKRMDRQIQKHLAPEKPMAASTLTAGIIVGLIGVLLLLLTSGVGQTLGLIAVVVGIVLVILGLL